MSSGVKKSGAPCGPYSTPISHSLVYSGSAPAGAVRCGTTAARSAATAAHRPRAARGPHGRRNLPRMNVLRLPRYSGTSKPPATARYARLPGPCAVASSSMAPARHLQSICHSGTGVPSSVAPKSAPVSAIVGVAREPQRRARDRDFQPRRAFRITHQPVRQAERQRVHRTRRRHADMPVAQPPRIILHRRLRPASITSIALRWYRKSRRNAVVMPPAANAALGASPAADNRDWFRSPRRAVAPAPRATCASASARSAPRTMIFASIGS